MMMEFELLALDICCFLLCGDILRTIGSNFACIRAYYMATAYFISCKAITCTQMGTKMILRC